MTEAEMLAALEAGRVERERPSTTENHIRVRVRAPRGRRGYSGRHFALIANRPTVARTLCGAPVSSRDVDECDARIGKKKGELDSWVSCVACRAKV